MDYAQKELQDLVRSVRAKKRFGQNFLVQQTILNKIIQASAITPQTSVIEIGPGPGSLTRWLLKTHAKAIHSLEMDRDMLPFLEPLVDDVLSLHFTDALKEDFWQLGNAPRTVVSNLPYNIATPLLIKMIEHRQAFQRMVLMFQKEVADRIVAQPDTSSYGRLAVLCQVCCKVSKVTDVPPSAFVPQPKVDSAVVSLEPYDKPLHPVDIPSLQRLLHHVFQKRRKMLRGSLKGFVDEPIDLLTRCDIDPKKRPESLTLEEFCRLAQACETQD